MTPRFYLRGPAVALAAVGVMAVGAAGAAFRGELLGTVPILVGPALAVDLVRRLQRARCGRCRWRGGAPDGAVHFWGGYAWATRRRRT